jgi:hypothetical protein
VSCFAGEERLFPPCPLAFPVGRDHVSLRRLSVRPIVNHRAVGSFEDVPKFTTAWSRLPYEDQFKPALRDFTDRFFKLIAWTIYVSVLLGLYFKTKSALFLVIAVSGHALIAVNLWTYLSDVQNYIIEHSENKDRWWFQLPILLAVTALSVIGARVSLQIAGELLVWGR